MVNKVNELPKYALIGKRRGLSDEEIFKSLYDLKDTDSPEVRSLKEQFRYEVSRASESPENKQKFVDRFFLTNVPFFPPPTPKETPFYKAMKYATEEGKKFREGKKRREGSPPQIYPKTLQRGVNWAIAPQPLSTYVAPQKLPQYLFPEEHILRAPTIEERLTPKYIPELRADKRTSLEQAVVASKEVSKGAGRGVFNIGSGINAALTVAAKDAGWVLEKSPKTKTARDLMSYLEMKTEEGIKYWDIMAQKEIIQPSPEVSAGSFQENPSFLKAVTLGAQALPSLAMATGITVATGNPWAGALALGALEGLPMQLEAERILREKGDKWAVEKSMFIGIIATAGIAALEFIPLNAFLNGSTRRLVPRMFIGGLYEGGQEGMQELYQNIVAKLGYDDTRKLSAGIVDAIIAGAMSGGAMYAFQGGPSSKLQQLQEKAKELGVPQKDLNALTEEMGLQIVSVNDLIENRISKKRIKAKEKIELKKREGALFEEEKALMPKKPKEEAKPTPEAPKPKIEEGKIPKELEPLAKEARKYKSAEEFYENILFHGTTEERAEKILGRQGLLGNKGRIEATKGKGIRYISTTPDVNAALGYASGRGKTAVIIGVPQPSRMVNLGDIRSSKQLTTEGQEFVRKFGRQELNWGGKEIENYLKNKNYDAIRFMAPDGHIEVRIFGNVKNPLKLPSGFVKIQETTFMGEPSRAFSIDKSQLTNFYNQAIKEAKPTPKEAPKPKLNAITEMFTGIGIESAVNKLEQRWDKFAGEKITKPLLEFIEKYTPISLKRIAGPYLYGRPEKFKVWYENRINQINIGLERTNNTVQKMLKDYSIEERMVILDMVRKEAPIIPNYRTIVTEIRGALDKEGAKAVKAGLLKRDVYRKNIGKYFPRLYKHYEVKGWRPDEATIDRAKTYLKESLKEKNPKWKDARLDERAENQINHILNGKPITIYNTLTRKPLRLDLRRFRHRQDIPKPIRDLLGEYQDPTYPYYKTMYQLTWDNATAELFNQVANSELTSKTAKEGFSKLPTNPKLGKLSGKFVDSNIAQDIQWINIKLPKTLDKSWRLYSRGLSLWKAGKVFNPATMFRNMFSNIMLANNAYLSPWRIDVYEKALKELRTKGEWYQRAIKDGLQLKTFGYELSNFMYNTFNASTEKHILDKTIDIANKGLNKGIKFMGELYEGEEAWTKLAVYINGVENLKIDSKIAAKEAEENLFHYGKVPIGINVLRKSGIVPFPTFYYKVASQMPKWAIQRPLRFWPMVFLLKFLTQQILKHYRIKELDEKEFRKATKILLPRYLKDRKFLILPYLDKYNRLQLLDFTYIYPFDPWELVISSKPPWIRPQLGPFITIPQDVSRNRQFYSDLPIWDKDIDTNKEILQKMCDYTYKQLMPPLAPKVPGITKGGYSWQKIESAIRGEMDYRGRIRSLPMSLLDALAGVKITPMDLTQMLDWKKSYYDSVDRKLQVEIQKIAQDFREKKISEKTYQRELSALMEKRRRLSDEYTKLAQAFADINKLVEKMYR